MAVPFAARVRARFAERNVSWLRVTSWPLEVQTGVECSGVERRWQQALGVAQDFAGGRAIEFEAECDIPKASGMGSSGALGVAVMRAIDDLQGQASSKEDIFRRSLLWERIFHGTPSGIDNGVATYGGMVWFSKTWDPDRPTIESVHPKQMPCLIAVSSGQTHDAAEMVGSVNEQLESEPQRVGAIFDEIASIVVKGAASLRGGRLDTLGDLMNENHVQLRKLKVSTETLDEMVRIARDVGALGAKLTGAGGGGCALALARSCRERSPIEQALARFGNVYHLCGLD
jgi:mevalonate kinase